MANLFTTVLLQSTASNNANTAVFNASMQQVAANKAQRNNNHNCMMQQFAMMLTISPITLFTGQPTSQPARWPQAATQQNFIPQAVPILAPVQKWGQPLGGGCRSTRSRNGRGHPNPRSPAQQGTPIPFVKRNQMIPYIPASVQLI
jgi:hypothetical protein